MGRPIRFRSGHAFVSHKEHRGHRESQKGKGKTDTDLHGLRRLARIDTDFTHHGLP